MARSRPQGAWDGAGHGKQTTRAQWQARRCEGLPDAVHVGCNGGFGGDSQTSVGQRRLTSRTRSCPQRKASRGSRRASVCAPFLSTRRPLLLLLLLDDALARSAGAVPALNLQL
jgi:hypothetical protein